MHRHQAINKDACTILIAERNSRIGNLLEKTFQNRGYPVCVASNGYEAAEMLLREKPALIVLDPDLPYLFALTEAGRDILNIQIPVILHPLSAMENADLAMPASSTVYKDADPEHLLLAVETTLTGQATREDQR